ncbi:hypothetical protein H5368_12090 [Luteimonas sp. MC1782]|uniref:hypothetical protein n=1 Tax=Luteimonas sp. MC1782 TaxID=2760305 RepID=UPI0016002521|nr:hypothetical protein [Luteimonas sp. MC1782]MBB1473773.1 hypothetical protein [Luteimonas sp. MC1782]
MRLPAGLASLGVMLGYAALIPLYPGFGLLQPRGGLVMLTISLAIANTLVWLAGNPAFSAHARFQLGVAGWIWILVQAGAQVYLHAVAG